MLVMLSNYFFELSMERNTTSVLPAVHLVERFHPFCSISATV